MGVLPAWVTCHRPMPCQAGSGTCLNLPPHLTGGLPRREEQITPPCPTLTQAGWVGWEEETPACLCPPCLPTCQGDIQEGQERLWNVLPYLIALGQVEEGELPSMLPYCQGGLEAWARHLARPCLYLPDSLPRWCLPCFGWVGLGALPPCLT